MKEVQISQLDVYDRKMEKKKDFVAEETPLHIFLNQIHFVTILCSPNQLKELAVGHLISEGVLKSVEEIKEIRFEEGGKCVVRLKKDVDADKRISAAQPFARLIVSACGSTDYWPLSKIIDRLHISKVPSSLQVEARVILDSVKQLNMIAETFRKTGGVHIAAAYSPKGELRTFAEDVGRHNAVDKVIGTCVLEKLDFNDCFLASSGRLSGDIVLKAARMKVQAIASLTTALNSGIEIAQHMGVTLIGFVRGKRMNIYTYPERISEYLKWKKRES
jgi:FdhD protein